ncbi:phosphatase PAP2 family protein [Microbacter margulisiae]|uniref:Phosphoglycerol transferase MdoB-like AlkP superfamily enzyme n=1 Tax=Microbacter margulisiae TaxID=1350067 RepID=A0A7W5DSY2_9PORP|nr:phosphatase PAP2 family protein [Microbacter margulisiae]MBB3188502.1 phosphoglycerol transferase MdoB-like AlkP superfamily enzyme [Microbacter margulisiae]
MKRLASILSIIFSPLLVPTYGILLFFTTRRFEVVPFLPKLIVGIIVFVCTGLLPGVILYFFMKTGKVSSVNLEKKEERTLPYIFSLVLYLFCALYLWKVNMPLWFVMMVVGSTVALVVLMLVNLKWKMSAHLSALGGVFGGIFVVAMHYVLNPVALIVGTLFIAAAVATSRLILGVHTPLQTLAGFVNGFVLVMLFGLLFG